MSPLELFVEIAGWAGALLILGGYFGVSTGRLTPRSALFQGMNVVGAAGFILNSWWHGAVPSAALNVVWMMIGIYTLWRISKPKGSPTSAL